MRYWIEGRDNWAGSGWSPETCGNTDNEFPTYAEAEEARQQLIGLDSDWTEDNTRVAEIPGSERDDD